MLKVNDQAPAFTLPNQDDELVRLDDLRGQYVLLYFYPKDDTPGCTKEACAIRDVYDEFAKQSVRVLGVSKDSSESHRQFIQKYELPFTLLSDESTDMIQAYGAWGEKQSYGKTYLGTLRISYLIDPVGKIVRVYPKVDPANHAVEILNDLKGVLTK